jgi:hypothetical protein
MRLGVGVAQLHVSCYSGGGGGGYWSLLFFSLALLCCVCLRHLLKKIERKHDINKGYYDTIV